MKKYGKIPPHFIYFLESESVQIKDLKSSNLTQKNNYDRMIVKFPYGSKSIDIQIIFDFLNSSNPPDFIILEENNILLDYFYLINDWNFKESSSLYFSLIKIKNSYTQSQNKRLIEEIENNKKISEENFNNENEYNNNIKFLWSKIKSIHSLIIKKIKSNKKSLENLNKSVLINENFNKTSTEKIKDRFERSFLNNKSDLMSSNKSATINSKNNHKYVKKEIEKINEETIKEKLPEINFSYKKNKTNIDYTDYKDYITISYPFDIEFNSKNLIKYPYVDITIYLNFEHKFTIDFHVPDFIEADNSRNRNEKYDLKEYDFYLERFEKGVHAYLKDFNFRERIIKGIIDLNLGFTLEIDSSSFKNFAQSLYLKEQIISSSKNSQSTSVKYSYRNIMVNYIFDKIDENIFIVNLIDTDEFMSINSKKIILGQRTEKDLNDIINEVLEFIINNI